MNIHKIKQDMCDIGLRIYNRQFAAANDGNITVRISENEVLCTPTMHCKGFLKPEDIATIDFTGKQIAGRKKRSSEALLHLEIYRQRPEIKSVVHCHPPHATAFAIAREPIPQCILPEVEVFLGDVPITKYETPGGQDFADTIRPFVDRTNVIILANHGTVSYGESVERAYWWTEILDSYCRMLLLAKQLGRQLEHDRVFHRLDHLFAGRRVERTKLTKHVSGAAIRQRELLAITRDLAALDPAADQEKHALAWVARKVDNLTAFDLADFNRRHQLGKLLPRYRHE